MLLHSAYSMFSSKQKNAMTHVALHKVQPSFVQWRCICVQVLELSADVLQKIPALIDYEGTRKLLKDDLSPLNVVLLQEIQRYNILLHTIRSVCVRL